MKYHLIIEISRKQISFSYCKDSDGTPRMRSFGGEWPAPLAIYCHSSELEIGEAALRAANSGVEGAYKDIFEVSKNEGYFEFNGHRRPLNQLILAACEHQFSKFFRDELVQTAGTLENNTATLPVSFIFGVDLKDNEIEYVMNLFMQKGYSSVSKIDYNEYIIQSLKSDISTKEITVISTDGNDLFLRYYNDSEAYPTVQIPGFGKDRRLQRAIEEIKKAILREDPYIDLSAEMGRIEEKAQAFIESGKSTVNDYITLSDGVDYHYFLAVSKLGSGGDIKMETQNRLEAIFEKLGSRIERNTLILKGKKMCNPYFVNLFRPMFASVLEVSGDNHVIVLSNIAKTILGESEDDNPVSMHHPITSGPPQIDAHTPPLFKITRKEWREVSADASSKAKLGKRKEALSILEEFIAKCKSAGDKDFLIHAMDLRKDIESMPEIEVGPPPIPPIDPEVEKRINKEWRNVRADARGKNRSGKVDEAIALLENFLKICKKENIETLIVEVSKELDSFASKPKVDYSSVNNSAPKKDYERKEDKNQGEEYISQGKLKEARDWYREVGNVAKAKVLAEIIRAKRGVETREKQIEDYRRSSDKMKIMRVVDELQEYIDLCKKGGVKCDEVKKLLNEYKSIKVKK